VAVRRTTQLTGIAPQFLVDDLDRAIAYYRNKLGFELDFEYQSFYASVTRDGFAIHLKHAPKLAADREHPEAERTSGRIHFRCGHPSFVQRVANAWGKSD
jgi:catechol 2,3-dioxygenase-like lactoylglutathione lyase family enzyme